MAPRRRTTRPPARSPRRTRSSGLNLGISPQTARALVGVALLVIGAVTLIALMLPAGGVLNRYVSEFLRPAFGQGAWLLPLVLIAAGFLVERGPGTGTGWGVTALGGVLIFLGGLGLIQLIWGHGTAPAQLAAAGGWVGQALAGPTAALVSPAGAFVVLAGIVTAGLLLLLNSTIRGLLHPVAAGGRALAGVMAGPDAPAGRATGLGRPLDRRRRRCAAGRRAWRQRPARPGRRTGRAGGAGPPAARRQPRPAQPDGLGRGTGRRRGRPGRGRRADHVGHRRRRPAGGGGRAQAAP